MNKSFINPALIILIIFPVLSDRSYKKCEHNFDCESCVKSSGNCMWSVQSESHETDNDEPIINMNVREHELTSHSFFECKPKSGLFNVNNNTAHSIKQKYSKTTSSDFCNQVNKDYKNRCSHPSRNTIESCVGGNSIYKHLGFCAWDIQWEICVNKAIGKPRDHPESARFWHTVQGPVVSPPSTLTSNKSNDTSNWYNLLGALIIVCAAFTVSCLFYHCCSKKSVKARFPVIDYEVHLHEAKRGQNVRVTTNEPNDESKTDIIASNI